VITGLGTGEHLESWDFEPSKIIELDWFESQDLGNGFKINAEPARHFSGRGFKRDQAIWASFVLETPLKFILAEILATIIISKKLEKNTENSIWQS
jgi:L-ascorbate metabolism protein UlaG (beta-lactamase superfamily)